MYTREGLKAIRRYVIGLFGGDSDFRYDSREAFYQAHQPQSPLQFTGEVICVIILSPDDGLHYFPPGTKSADVVWETNPETGRLIGYVPKALPMRGGGYDG